MKKKKIVFFLVDLNLGGVEKSFINKINKLDLTNLDVTLVLEHKRGVFLNELPKNLKIIDYNLSECKIIFIRKIINRIKYIFNIIMHYKKYDIAVNEGYYSRLLAGLAFNWGKKSVLWVHNNFSEKWSAEECKKFYKYCGFEKYDKLVFVSQKALDDYKKVNYSHQELILCYNLIPEYKEKNKTIKKRSNKFTFLCATRLNEEQKRISRLIEACKILKDKRQDFELLIIGDGEDKKLYHDLITKYHLNNYIKLLGFKENVAMYYNMCDTVVMSSDYEGFPVVYCECINFKKHLLTTDVSDAKVIFDDTQVTITSKDPKDIAEKMNYLIDNLKKYNNFDIKKFNNEIEKQYKKILEIDS